ncbi:hypothetical protein DRQ50_05160 [bacterium]|nr:MAG: hypothetical protein DRQ50_05160 [bacterium]
MLLLSVALMVMGTAGVSYGQESLADNSPRLALPRSKVDEPFDAPVLVGLYLAGGGGLETDQGPLELGYGGQIVMRPGTAVSFLDFLYDWNTGLVLQVDYQELSDTDTVLSGDGILRYYFSDRGRNDTEVRLFAGLGVGASSFSVPGTDGKAKENYWSAVVEVGQEWLVEAKWMFFLRAQYRVNLRRHSHWGAVSLQAGAGVPWPI